MKNTDFADRYDRDVDGYLRARRNIFERRFMSAEQATSDLAVGAGRDALDRSGLSPTDIDLIILATDTPDYLSPSTASVVQYKLGAVNAGTFDLNAACAGFVTALDVASKYLRADSAYRHILVIGAYGISRYLDESDYRTATVFADGAGAVILSAGSKDGILACKLATEGRYCDAMGIFAGGTREPLSMDVLEARRQYLRFPKPIPPDFNTVEWPRLARELSGRLNIEPINVHHYFFSQINIETIREVMSVLEIPVSRAFNIMDYYGYTGSACIPMALALADRAGRLNDGDLVMLLVSGGGLATAGLALRWGRT